MVLTGSTVAELAHFAGVQHHSLAEGLHQRGDFANAQVNFGVAEEWYRRAIAEDDQIKFHEALMFALISQRRHAEALPHCDVAMQTTNQEKKVLAQFTRGLTYLNVGNYPAGFQDLVSRTTIHTLCDMPHFEKIRGLEPWDGRPVDHLLVYSEAGFGDCIMFARFLPMLLERGLVKRLTVEVPDSIVSLVQHNFPFAKVVPYSRERTPSDQFALMMNLPLALGTTIDTVPPVSFRAEPAHIEKWAKIGALPGLKVGLCWHGREAREYHTAYWNKARNIALTELVPVIATPGTTFVSLQKGKPNDDLRDFPAVRNYDSEIESWSDQGGIMHHLDLVVSIDSGPVHLAASLGKPTWLLNHVASCWRWKFEGTRTPWYDSARIFRQRREGDWSDPVEAVAKQLSALASRGSISQPQSSAQAAA